MKNDYDADEEVSLEELEGAGLRWMSVAVVMLVVAGFFALAWYAYQSSHQGEGGGIVRAEAGPVKVKPADPGGMQTPYQDMSVYNVISDQSGQTEEPVEQLLPEPEEPMVSREAQPDVPRKHEDMKVWIREEGNVEKPLSEDAPAHVKLLPPPVVKAPLTETAQKSEETDVNSAEQPKRFMDAPAQAKKPMEKTPQENVSLPPETKPVSSNAEPKTSPKPLAIPEQKLVSLTPATKTVAAAPPATQETGNAFIQLAALKTPAEATTTWNQIKRKHSDLLGGKQYLIVKADLPQGTFYRLRVSGLSANGAKQLCSALSARGQSCMVTR